MTTAIDDGTAAEGLQPLIEVAAAHALSYHVLLRLVMTRRVRGARRGRSWLADPTDTARWMRERTATEVG